MRWRRTGVAWPLLGYWNAEQRQRGIGVVQVIPVGRTLDKEGVSQLVCAMMKLRKFTLIMLTDEIMNNWNNPPLGIVSAGTFNSFQNNNNKTFLASTGSTYS